MNLVFATAIGDDDYPHAILSMTSFIKRLILFFVTTGLVCLALLVCLFLTHSHREQRRNLTNVLPAKDLEYWALYEEASGLFLREDYEKAIACYERLLRLTEKGQDSLLVRSCRMEMARCYIGLGEIDKAEQIYHSQLAISPGDDQALQELGTIMKRKGELEQALDCFQKAKAAAPVRGSLVRPVFTNFSAWTFGPENSYNVSSAEIARLQFCLGNYAAAREIYELICKANPKSADREREALNAIDEVFYGRKPVRVDQSREASVHLNLKELMRVPPANEDDPVDIARYADSVLGCLPKEVHFVDTAEVYVLLLAKGAKKHPEALQRILPSQSRVIQRELVTHTLDGLLPSRRESKRKVNDAERIVETDVENGSSPRVEHGPQIEEELKIALIEARYFVAGLLAENALEVAEAGGIHSQDVKWDVSSTSFPPKYPLKAKAVINYETKTNVVSFYLLVKGGTNANWRVEKGWTVGRGTTNLIEVLPTGTQQQSASEMARIGASAWRTTSFKGQSTE
ncbi:MAG: tetratricopeptide repeat protein [Verrucomicrobiae bacterium]|nr:tetratricopeptide repeat protein [Verrucomicrobiae bacterium]